MKMISWVLYLQFDEHFQEAKICLVIILKFRCVKLDLQASSLSSWRKSAIQVLQSALMTIDTANIVDFSAMSFTLACKMEFMKHRLPVLTNPLGCSLSVDVSTYCWESSITLLILLLTASSRSVTGKLLDSEGAGVS